MENYEKVEYSKGQIKKAGEALANCSGGEIEKDLECLKIVDNWRAAHAFPLDTISKGINEVLSNQEGVMIVQRLKRLESIIGKLRRHNHTALYRMQDLGGCRVIVPTVKDVYSVVEVIKEYFLQQGYEIQKEYDYLAFPPENSGYRSYHIVVKYRGTNEYDGMFIEVQVRTRLQNTWATAVEIIDCITNESLKAGTGNTKYRYFFKLVSALFSIKEKTAVVEGVPNSHELIVKELYRIEREERIREKLSAYSTAITLTGDYEEGIIAYYLLVIDMRKREVMVIPFKHSEIREAVDHYHDIEKHVNKYGTDVVLVAGHSIGSLKESYQNYLLGAQSFLSNIAEMCSGFPEKPSIILDTSNGSRKITDLFAIHYYKGCTPEGIHLNEDGIGIGEGGLIYCPDWPITLQDSYLRYSGIYVDEAILAKQPEIKEHIARGPGLIVSRMGACFLIAESEWKFVSESDTMILTPKDGTLYDQLLLLLCWLKSNLFTWDLLWNKNVNSAYYQATKQTLLMPRIEGKALAELVDNAVRLLQEEKHFVRTFNEKSEAGLMHNSLEYMDTFNKNILIYLQKIESIFADYYHVSREEQTTISHELRLKGYFSYVQ